LDGTKCIELQSWDETRLEERLDQYEIHTTCKKDLICETGYLVRVSLPFLQDPTKIREFGGEKGEEL